MPADSFTMQGRLATSTITVPGVPSPSKTNPDRGTNGEPVLRCYEDRRARLCAWEHHIGADRVRSTFATTPPHHKLSLRGRKGSDIHAQARRLCIRVVEVDSAPAL